MSSSSTRSRPASAARSCRLSNICKRRGCRLVLGIRDVMDEPALLVPEWERKGAKEALIRYYDEIWVYGLKDVYQPLKALEPPAR